MVKHMIKAVIFDKDGVLHDSEYANIRAGELAFEQLSAQLTKEERNSIVGRHVDDYAPPLLKKYKLDYDEMRQLQKKLYYELVESTPVFEKTIAMLKNIHAKGVTVALCTSAAKENTMRLLDDLKITNLFQEIVTKNDYSKRKPDPEPYITTAQKLGLEPQECLVVEDSEVGMQAALAAGMRCIVIFNDYTKDHNFAGATQVVDSADKLDVSKILSI